jgi:beta-galactosidase
MSTFFKIKTLLIATAILSFFMVESADAAGNRVTININAGWKFTKGDISGAQAAGYIDTSWTSVGLPHSASIPFFIEDSAYIGWVWYRKHFPVDAQYSGRKVFIDFEAAFQHAWVYINGQLVGEHKGGYTGFTYDITPYVLFGQTNVCAVRLSNLWDATIAPRAGDSWFHAGIYRDVSLVITDPLHVKRLGTFVTTPQVSATRASVNIKTEIVNQGTASKTCTVSSTVLDSNGLAVIGVSTSNTIAVGETLTVSQDTAIANPKLWSPSSPYRYKVLTQVLDNGTEVDEFVTQFGVRWYSATAANGFSLNGQKLYLRGFNVHQDRAGWADAATNYDFYRDLKMLKDAGTNCVRCSHYPHDMAFYDACDRLGILAFAELQFWGRGGFSGGGELNNWFAEAYPTVDAARPEFEANLTANFRDMIREARNHPSIFAWSLGNETDMQMPAAVVTNAKAFWIRLDSLSHQLDPSRYTSCGWVVFAFNTTPPLVDLVGENGGNPTVQRAYPVLTTEYGSCIADRPGDYTGCDEPTADAWRCGALRWLSFHHATHCEGINGNWAHMGVIDYHRLPLRQYYWTRNAWLGTAAPTWPVAGTASKLRVTADKTTVLDDGTDDCQLVITVLDANNNAINNSVNATLTITSGPGLLPTGKSWSFSTPDGQQAIEMRAYGVGTTAITASSNGLQSGSIQITSSDPVVVTAVNPSIMSAHSPQMPAELHSTNCGVSHTILISYRLPEKSDCTIRIVSMRGETIRSFQARQEQAGSHSVEWNCRDNRSRKVGNGCYLVVLETPGMNILSKVHLLQ